VSDVADTDAADGRRPGDLAPEPARPAFYAAAPGGWRDWWTLLHPPYTAWHLSYVVIGACLAPRVQVSRLVITVVAFLLAVGVGAHALDELHGRPLRTRIPRSALLVSGIGGVVAAVGLGVAGVVQVGWGLAPWVVLGPVLVIAYNAEPFGGRLHTGAIFAAGWGAFPVLTAYVAQTGRLALAPILGAAACYAVSVAQRTLSTPARTLRRRVIQVSGTVTLATGAVHSIDRETLLRPLEEALRALSWGMVVLATALAVARLT
jgi:hypothetical protein